MSIREIKQVLLDISRNNKDFPILDLTKIIIDYVYEIPTKCVQTLLGHNGNILALAELKDGSIASGSYDHTIKIFKKPIGNDEKSSNFSDDRVCVQTLFAHQDVILALIELKDGSLASGSYDHTIKIWGKNADIFEGKNADIFEGKNADIFEGKNDKKCVQTLSGHTDAVRTLIELKDGRLASGSWDQTIKIWDKNNGTCVETLSGHNDGVLSLTELKDGRLASGSADHTIKIWGKNASIFEGKNAIIFEGKNNEKYVRTLSGHTDEIWALLELKDGSLASGSYDSTIKIWSKNADIFECIQTLSGHTDRILSLIELKDGRLASASYDNTIKIWSKNADIFECIQTLSGHEHAVSSLIELKDGRLVSGSMDRTIKIWS